MDSFKSFVLLIVLGVLFSVGASMYVNNDENTTNASESQQNQTQDVTNSDDDTPNYVIDTWPQDLIDSIAGQNRTQELEKLAAGNRRKRSVSCDRTGVLKIVAFYDEAFLSRFGNEVGAEARLDSVFAHMQTFMNLDSLSVNVNGVVINKFRLDLVEKKYISGQTISASGAGLRTFRDKVLVETGNGVLRTDIQAYMLFSSQNDRGGTVGIAWLETTCSRYLQYRTSLSEYYISDAVTAEIAVHELAHNLAAEHDFLSSPDDPRYDSNGNLCTGIGGVMDYYNVPDKWSTCSNEDIGTYFSSLDVLCFPIEDNCPTPTGTAAPPCTPTPAPTTTTTESPACSCNLRGDRRRRKCCKATIGAGFCCYGCEKWC